MTALASSNWEKLQASSRVSQVAWKKKDGTAIAVSLSAHPFAGSDGNITFEAFAEDITQRKRDETELRRLNRILSALGTCNRALVHATDEAQLLSEICRIVVEVGGYRMAWVGYAQEGEARPVRLAAKAGFDEGYLDNAHITWNVTNGAAVRLVPQFAPARCASLTTSCKTRNSLSGEMRPYVAAMFHYRPPFERGPANLWRARDLRFGAGGF